MNGLARGIGDAGGRKRAVGVVIVMEGEADLLEVVAALHAARGLARPRAAIVGKEKCGEQDKDGDEGEKTKGDGGPAGEWLGEV